ncbi:hypothetical protein HPL003_04185 [Paenibacillus terrae HPL-003]|uniref:Aminoglycoside phosphotransferase domain-containing protein n=1 Tax=Paenibacillus terrae (strain HPL-003) TaxID=985665 RepID=G7VUK1_PAETH|nr:hypothetical protein [Paenibacillus terrae]AET57608.1 hypothetical protein HPL003_04185 [Paenibacillus terrae HPL-003]
MIPQIKNYVETNWNRFFEIKPSNFQFLLLSNPQGKKITHGKCTVLIFKDHEAKPTLVAKFLRDRKGRQEKIVGEYKILDKISGWGRAPQPFDLLRINNRYVSFEEFKPGISLKSRLQRMVNKLSLNKLEDVINQVRSDFRNTGVLLNGFGSIEIPTLEIDEDSNYAHKALENYDGLTSLLSLSDNNLELLKKMVEDYKEIDQPAKMVHFDVTPSNIIVDKGELKLIDFEFSTHSKSYFLDPFRFSFYYFYLLYELNLFRGLSCEASFYYFFVENEITQSIVHEFFEATIEGYRQESLFHYMSLFLLSNLQLQIDETDFINDGFVAQTNNLLTISLDVIQNNEVNLTIYESKVVEMTDEEVRIEYGKCQDVITKYEAAIQEKDQQLAQNLEYIEHCHKVVAEKDKELLKNTEYIEHCHATITEKDEQLEENNRYISLCHNSIKEKDEHLAVLQENISQKEQSLVDLKAQLMQHEQLIASLQEKLNQNPFVRAFQEFRKR